MIIRTLHFLFFLVLVSTSCLIKSESDLSGVFVKEPSKNTIDSLLFFTDSVHSSPNPKWELYKYEQRFYKKSGELLFISSDFWRLDGGKLVLRNFYWDTDTKPEGSFYGDVLREKKVGVYETKIEDGRIFIDKNTYYRKVKK